MFRPNLKSVALPFSEIIAVGVLGGSVVANLQSREGAIGGREWYRPKER